ncbi:MAG: hypothetical protein DMG01_24590, partial [Acidobacteria bacterium]
MRDIIASLWRGPFRAAASAAIAIRLRRGGRVAGSCLNVIGRNGSGKSTLLKMMSGEVVPDAGTVWQQPALRVARLEQDIPLSEHRTVFDIVAEGHTHQQAPAARARRRGPQRGSRVGVGRRRGPPRSGGAERERATALSRCEALAPSDSAGGGAPARVEAVGPREQLENDETWLR